MLSFNLFIDADSSPVKKETILIAERHDIRTFVVSNRGMRPNHNHVTKTVLVEKGADKANDWVVAKIKKLDIVITSDIALAKRCIEREALVISHNGFQITKKNIGLKLASRNLMAEIRSADPFFTEKGNVFAKHDRIRFLNTLEKIVQTIIKSL